MPLLEKYNFEENEPNRPLPQGLPAGNDFLFTNEANEAALLNQIDLLLHGYQDGTKLWTWEDVREFDELIRRFPELMDRYVPGFTQNQDYYRMAAGEGLPKKDYSHLSDMDQFWIGFYSSRNFWQNKEQIFTNEHEARYFFSQEKLYDPFLRHGIELASRAEPSEQLNDREVSFCQMINSQMNRQILVNTLTPPTEKTVKSLREENPEAQSLLKKSIKANTTLAKTLLMMHLGGFYVVDDLKKEQPDPSRPYDGTMGDILAHGGRTIFIWKKKEPMSPAVDSMENAFLGKGAERAAYGRTFGTHSAAFEHHENVADQIEETRNVSARHNYGMDLAIGGFGMKNPGGKTILNGGENGHMFVHLLESREDRNGAMFVGIEGSAPGKTDFTGNIHDFHARSAKFSSFMGDKFGTVGAKMGGRRVDLTMYREKDLIETMDRFGEYYTRLQENCLKNIPGARRELSDLNRKLSGQHLDVPVLSQILCDVRDAVPENAPVYHPEAMLQSLTRRDSSAQQYFAHLDRNAAKQKDLSMEDFSRMDWSVSKKVRNTLNDILDRMAVSQKKIIGSGSPKFRTMMEKTEEMKQALERVPRDMEAIDRCAAELENAANMYLILKSAGRLSKKTRERVEIAMDVLKFTGHLSHQRANEKAAANEARNQRQERPTVREQQPLGPGL